MICSLFSLVLTKGPPLLVIMGYGVWFVISSKSSVYHKLVLSYDNNYNATQS